VPVCAESPAVSHMLRSPEIVNVGIHTVWLHVATSYSIEYPLEGGHLL